MSLPFHTARLAATALTRVGLAAAPGDNAWRPFAQRAFPHGNRRVHSLRFGVEQRARVFSRALDILVARPDEFADVVRAETGKSTVEALMMEVFASCNSLGYWSKRPGAARALLRADGARRCHARHGRGALEAPFGGVKASGVGRVNGEDGLRGFCHAQSIIVERVGRKREIVWYPHSRATEATLRKAMRWIWGSPLRRLLS